jgi:hypothetical protein
LRENYSIKNNPCKTALNERIFDSQLSSSFIDKHLFISTQISISACITTKEALLMNLKKLTAAAHAIYKEMEENRWFVGILPYSVKEQRFNPLEKVNSNVRLAKALISFSEEDVVKNSTSLKSIVSILVECANFYLSDAAKNDEALETVTKNVQALTEAYNAGFNKTAQMEAFLPAVDVFIKEITALKIKEIEDKKLIEQLSASKPAAASHRFAFASGNTPAEQHSRPGTEVRPYKYNGY